MVEAFINSFTVPLILFMVVVAPTWLALHYRSRGRSERALGQAERAELEALAERAEQMAERIETLESILDVEAPGWRKRAEAE